MKIKAFLFLALSALSGCWLGHKEVKYYEMSSPPQLTIAGDEIIIKTSPSLKTHHPSSMKSNLQLMKVIKLYS
ncbi:MAG: hypothetical protein QM734_06135 [Cyclobacteriaceae bacterium]